MLPTNIEQLAKLHIEQRMAEAEQERLARQVLTNRRAAESSTLKGLLDFLLHGKVETETETIYLSDDDDTIIGKPELPLPGKLSTSEMPQMG